VVQNVLPTAVAVQVEVGVLSNVDCRQKAAAAAAAAAAVAAAAAAATHTDVSSQNNCLQLRAM
jgi:hypothetical protein